MRQIHLFDDGDEALLSVADLTRQIKSTLEDTFDDLRVEGEVSNFKRYSSGHCYFTLKDAESQIPCVMWRSAARYLFFTPENGMLVRTLGSLSVYAPRGAYQLMVRTMKPAGEGALQQAFEALKHRLEKEGLFDQIHKKTLPPYPETIGVVTSGAGAALRDVLSILARRFPQVRVMVCPVRVQGAGAAEEIAEAVRAFNALTPEDGMPIPDVLIVGRGGGSAEDLWAFNEEIVARALFASHIPIISAVGHEVDYSISDFVADARAATPSMAAELAVPDREEMRQLVALRYAQIHQLLTDQVEGGRQRVDFLRHSHVFNRPVDQLRQATQHLDERIAQLHRTARQWTTQKRLHLEPLVTRLHGLDPVAPLKRGYAFVAREGEPVHTAATLRTGDRITVRFEDGQREAEVISDDG